MIDTLPTGWRGRALAVGLAVLALMIAYLAVVSPLDDLYVEQATRLETQRALLAKLYAVAGELPELQRRLAALRAGANGDKFTLTEESDGVASAALQGHLGELAGGKGVRIGSSESLPVQVLGTYHRIGLRLAVRASYAQLIEFVGALEAERPPLIVSELQIHSFQQQPQGSPTAPVDAILEIHGFRADETAAAGKR